MPYRIMKRLVILTTLLLGSALMVQAQKSKVIAVFHLIETSKYGEAKTAIEEAIKDKRTWGWPRTWYARGLLCQTAYEEGKKENDKKKYELYPDQLEVALESYRKALSYDRSGRMDDQVAPYLVKLANAFLETGENNYKNGKYKEALAAYEHAMDINENPVLTVKKDTNLVYNTALAAYRSQEWDKAAGYLTTLNEYRYSPNVPLLLSHIHLAQEDSVAAVEALQEGAEKYDYHEEVVLELTDVLYQAGRIDEAVNVLDRARVLNPEQYVFPYTTGLVYQKAERYSEAIASYMEAIELAPDEGKIYRHIGTCYYNMGVDIRARARSITNINRYRREKARSTESFESAVTWFEKALGKEPGNREVMEKLSELYKLLNQTGKFNSMKEQLQD